jgi:hypothetical protein
MNHELRMTETCQAMFNSAGAAVETPDVIRKFLLLSDLAFEGCECK